MAKWKKGESGNPQGKKPGTLHGATRAAQALLDGEAEALTRKAIEEALNGNPIALRLCLERVVPPRKDRPITLELPKVKKAADIPQALAAVMAAVAGGDITPIEGQTVAAMLEAFRKGLELADLEDRVSVLEKRKEKKL